MRVVSEAKEEVNPRQRASAPSVPATSASTSRPGFEGINSPLEVGQTTVGHTNIISDLALVKHPDGRVFLVSAAMNGVVKFWK